MARFRKSIVTVALLVIVLPAISGATVIVVPSQQPTIQAGIDAASAGDTVRVLNGVYKEKITVDKPLQVESSSMWGATIEGNGFGDVIRITSNGVSLVRFRIEGIGTEQIFQGEWDAGVHMQFADSCLIANCGFSGGAAGVAIGCSQYNTVRNCFFTESEAGVYLYEPYGDDYALLRDNVGNKILHNTFGGIYSSGVIFEHGGWVHHVECEVRANVFYYNEQGMRMIMSESNEISYNLFEGNVLRGIGLGMCMGGGQYNAIHHNAFVNNGDTLQASDVGGGLDYWYDTASQEGNYWSDYEGEDLNGDGIGDTPYYVAAFGDTVPDRYPLMEIADADQDEWMDSVDNCPSVFNPDQRDNDGDMVGNACCCGIYSGGYTGNVDCDPYGKRDLQDITRLIDRIYLSHEKLCCPANGNTNGDPEGQLNLIDVTRLIGCIYVSHAETATCQ